MNSKAFDFDLFVIGGGSGGVRAARVAASLGARVALAEERYFGGTCVNVGCVPKKLMSYAASFRDTFEECQGFGWSSPVPRFEWSSFKANKEREIKRLEGIYKNLVESSGVVVFQQRARLAGANMVQVGKQTLTARHILLAVGGWPWIPSFEGNDLALNSNDIFNLERLPPELIIIGGGYIAVEFASILHRLGCSTRLVYRGEWLLNGFDLDLRQHFTRELDKSVTLVRGRTVSKIVKKNNRLVVSLDNGRELVTDAVLAATGRRPNTADLGLETVGIHTNPHGAIEVDKNFETGAAGVYAVGDVIDRLQLTPVALAEGEWLARHLFSAGTGEVSYQNVPTAVFSQPQVATVGLTEEQAKEQSVKVIVYSTTIRPLRHAFSGRDHTSFIKLVVDGKTDRVRGVHMIGPDASEILQGFAVALNCGATKFDFDRTIGIHPTLAEELVTIRKRGENTDSK